MFVDARELFRLKSLADAHAISFEWHGYVPEFLVYAADGKVSRLDLSGLLIDVSDGKTCVGRFAHDGYMPCPGRLPVNGYAQCQGCAGAFIPQLSCVFEPRCSGELCPDAQFCRREHKVYLAFLGDKPKIGMTSTRRLMRRIIEQGADAYSVVATAGNRMSARKFEKEIGSAMKLRQGYRAEDILAGYASNDWEKIGHTYESLKQDIESRFEIRLGELNFIDRYPLSLPLSGVPRRVETAGIHSGKVTGIKGRFMIYENDGGLRALDLADIVARNVRSEIHPV